MFKLILFAIIVSTSFVSSKSIDGKRIYHAISSGQGLYQDSDKVVILGSQNFEENVLGSSSAWLVEFYNSWCGHCIQFAPTWKDFGASISSWTRIVKIGAVDCSADVNSALCRDYEVMKYPTLRYFAPHSSKGNYGVETTKAFNVNGLRTKLIKQLLNTTAEQDWPSFDAYKGDLFSVWSKVPSSVKYAIFFVESKPSSNESDNDSMVRGVESILDMSAIPEVFATRVPEDSAVAQQLQLTVTPGISVLTRDNDVIPLTSNQIDNTRETRLQAVVKYLKTQGVTVPEASEEDVTPHVTKADDTAQLINVIQEEMNRPDHGDIVYQIDLETALRYSLEKDAPLKSANIEGERLAAMKSYVSVLVKYFPIDDNGREFLQSVNSSLYENDSFTPVQFQSLISDLISKHNPFLMKTKKDSYIGCSSRHLGLRRYPCSLWSLFHTLTVAADSKPHLSQGPKEVLHAMQDYIKHFFSCTDCANNFAKETGNLEESVHSLNDSILYLWKTHNHVNFRLHQFPGNRTEDPDHPKIQFPSNSHCPQCYTSSGDWNETTVLSYLKSIYSKISYKAMSEMYASTLSPSHLQTKREIPSMDKDPLAIDTRYFNSFDISLCVLLYFVSAGILILVALKFCLRKTHRKKNFIYDVLGKV